MTIRHRNGARVISLMLTVVFIMIQFLMTAPGDTRTLAAPALGFSDVTSENPNQPYINYVTTLGVISGFPDGTYRPVSSLTRAQAAAVLVKSLNLDTADVTSSGFQDVPASHWASKIIGAASKAGLLAGYGDGTFRPDRPLTRAEGIALIFRLTNSEIPPTALPPLRDVTASHWAASQIAAALDAKMMVLWADGLFAPDTSMSRGDMARALALMMVLAPEFSEQSLTCQATPESGTVKVRRSGEEDYQALSQPGIINPGDSIMTGDESVARLTFDDGTEIRMEPKTELILTNNQGYRYIKRNGEPGVGVDDLRLAMKSGEVFFALASDPNRQQTEQVTNPATPNRASTDRFFRQANPSRASNQRFFRQVTPTPSRAPAQTVAAGNNVAWWKKQQQVKTRLTVDMPVGMCGARSTFGNISFTSGGGWSMNLATGSGFLQTGSGQTNLQAGHEGSVDSRGQTSTNVMSQESINRWAQSMISQWMQNAAQQIDNNSGVQPSTATQQQSPPPPPPSTPTTKQVLAALNAMRSGQPPTQQNVQQQQQQQQQTSSNSGQNNAPTITAINESSTPPGAEVVITGSNFGQSQGIVTFGTAEATIISWSNTSITVLVPAGLSPGSYQVTVKQGSLSSSGYGFTVISPSTTRPTITGISTTEAEPGTEVEITGSNFGSSQGVVTFGAAEATIKSWSDTSITVEVPASLKPGSYSVKVMQDGLSSNGYGFIVKLPPIPVLPVALSGYVSIDGVPAPAGTIIEARIGGQVIGRIETEFAGRYGEPVKMIVGSSGGIEEEETFTLYVDGVEAGIGVFLPGTVSQIDLDA